MAMAVLNHLGQGNYIATSAGIMADRGAPINEKAKQALISAGILSSETNDYENHQATQLNMGIKLMIWKWGSLGWGVVGKDPHWLMSLRALISPTRGIFHMLSALFQTRHH